MPLVYNYKGRYCTDTGKTATATRQKYESSSVRLGWAAGERGKGRGKKSSNEGVRITLLATWKGSPAYENSAAIPRAPQFEKEKSVYQKCTFCAGEDMAPRVGGSKIRKRRRRAFIYRFRPGRKRQVRPLREAAKKGVKYGGVQAQMRPEGRRRWGFCGHLFYEHLKRTISRRRKTSGGQGRNGIASSAERKNTKAPSAGRWGPRRPSGL